MTEINNDRNNNMCGDSFSISRHTGRLKWQ